MFNFIAIVLKLNVLAFASERSKSRDVNTLGERHAALTFLPNWARAGWGGAETLWSIGVPTFENPTPLAFA